MHIRYLTCLACLFWLAAFPAPAPGAQTNWLTAPLEQVYIDFGWELDVPADWDEYDGDVSGDADILGMFVDPVSGSAVNVSIGEADDRLIELLRTDDLEKRSKLERALLRDLDAEFRRVGRTRQHGSAVVAELDGYGALRLRYWMSGQGGETSDWQVAQYLLPLDQGTYYLTLALTDGEDIETLDRRIAASVLIDPDLDDGVVPAAEMGDGYNALWHSSANYIDEETAGFFRTMALGGSVLLAVIALIIYIKYRQGFFKVNKK